MPRSFRELLEDRIASAYEGRAADFSRATGFTPQTVSAWRKGRVSLPQIDARRRLAKEFGITHVELLVVMGELDATEMRIPDDPRSDAVRRLQPFIDQIDWNSAKFTSIEGMLRLIADPERATAWSRKEH